MSQSQGFYFSFWRITVASILYQYFKESVVCVSHLCLNSAYWEIHWHIYSLIAVNSVQYLKLDRVNDVSLPKFQKVVNTSIENSVKVTSIPSFSTLKLRLISLFCIQILPRLNHYSFIQRPYQSQNETQDQSTADFNLEFSFS